MGEVGFAFLGVGLFELTRDEKDKKGQDIEEREDWWKARKKKRRTDDKHNATREYNKATIRVGKKRSYRMLYRMV